MWPETLRVEATVTILCVKTPASQYGRDSLVLVTKDVLRLCAIINFGHSFNASLLTPQHCVSDYKAGGR